MAQNEDPRIGEILTFWFEPKQKAPLYNRKEWWQKNPDFDQAIQQQFAALHRQAIDGALDSWQHTARGALALVLLLDQFSRNMFRGQPEMFAQDAKARSICKSALAQGFDQALSLTQQVFLFMPLEHSEQLEDQKLCVRRFEGITNQVPPEQKELAQFFLKFAQEHHDIIAQFGRFPHRNDILARNSTPEEAEFLKQHTGF